MTKKTYLVTGGCGFLGSALVRRLIDAGHQVRILDNISRGDLSRLDDVTGDFEYIHGDIRDADAVQRAAKGADAVCHLAFVNGTEFFYSHPELVLEVGVKGIMNVVDACLKQNIGELIVASSSEVYHEPAVIPTSETVPLCIPDPWNPRYSYAAGKQISEIVALNYGRTRFERVVIFRPHNVFGPDMGWEHVVPQFILRMKRQVQANLADPVSFPIQGTGSQTRAFVFIEDFTDGLMLVLSRGEHLGIYHIGTMEEITIEALAIMVGAYFGRHVEIVPTEPALGGAGRRCPDIRKLAALGYVPKWTMRDGLDVTAEWYDRHSAKCPNKNLGLESLEWHGKLG
jgi:nucleoside-diphosphate-sugar epimerase